jgi:hypothetical protein
LLQFFRRGLRHFLENVSQKDDGGDSLGKKVYRNAFTANEEKISALA